MDENCMVTESGLESVRAAYVILIDDTRGPASDTIQTGTAMQKLSESTKAKLKETEHLFWEYKDRITRRMYEIMFGEHPETRKLFKEFRKHQPDVLGAALMCHLVSLDEPEVLQSFRVSICRKHVLAGVQEEHYPMMAESLLKAMQETLEEKATRDMMDAWEKWFLFISSLLIEREHDHYRKRRLLFPADSDQF